MPETVGAHVTVPVYCAVSVIVVTGGCPSTGGATPSIAERLIGAAAVAGNTAVITPLFAELVAGVLVPATVK